MIIYCPYIYKCGSSNILLLCVLLTFIYIMDMLRVWPLLIFMIDFIGQSIIMHAEIYIVCSFKPLCSYYNYNIGAAVLVYFQANFIWPSSTVAPTIVLPTWWIHIKQNYYKQRWLYHRNYRKSVWKVQVQKTYED